MPLPGRSPEEKNVTLRRLILVSLLVPFFMLLGGWTGSRLHESLAGVNNRVRLAKTLLEPAKDASQPETFEITAYRSSGKPPAAVYAEASALLRQFYLGGWILGGFIGMVFGVILAGRLLARYRADYTPNRGRCFSCTRCVDYCPVDRPILTEDLP
jgi:ferredoxin